MSDEGTLSAALYAGASSASDTLRVIKSMSLRPHKFLRFDGNDDSSMLANYNSLQAYGKPAWFKLSWLNGMLSNSQLPILTVACLHAMCRFDTKHHHATLHHGAMTAWRFECLFRSGAWYVRATADKDSVAQDFAMNHYALDTTADTTGEEVFSLNYVQRGNTSAHHTHRGKGKKKGAKNMNNVEHNVGHDGAGKGAANA
jgi:hypothetical protein